MNIQFEVESIVNHTPKTSLLSKKSMYIGIEKKDSNIPSPLKTKAPEIFLNRVLSLLFLSIFK